MTEVLYCLAACMLIPRHLPASSSPASEQGLWPRLGRLLHAFGAPLPMMVKYHLTRCRCHRLSHHPVAHPLLLPALLWHPAWPPLLSATCSSCPCSCKFSGHSAHTKSVFRTYIYFKFSTTIVRVQKSSYCVYSLGCRVLVFVWAQYSSLYGAIWMLVMMEKQWGRYTGSQCSILRV